MYVWTKVPFPFLVLFVCCTEIILADNSQFIDWGLAILDPTCRRYLIKDVCPNKNVTFWLYTNNSTPHQLKETDKNSIKDAPFVVDKPIKFLLHGFTGNRTFDPNPQIRPNYLKIGYNVISIDYGEAAKEPCYRQSVDNAPIVAKCAAEFFHKLLHVRNDLKLDQIHLVGFSLGAQVAGKIGKVFKEEYGKSFKRVTGLDPAGPQFELNPLLTKNSGDFVDVIHTNVMMQGDVKLSGHVDFYVNKLIYQDGCGFDIMCNHVRAPAIFGESITTTKGFYGTKPIVTNCNQIMIMGEKTPNTARGIYYVKTNKQSPFAMGKPC